MKSDKKCRILFTYFDLPPFVKKDLDILKKHFEVIPLKYGGKKHIIMFLMRLLKEILKVDLTFSRCSSTNATFAVLFSKIFRKKSIAVICGFEVANVPEINYGFARSFITRAMIRFTLNNADKVLPLSEPLKRDAFKNVGGIKGHNIQIVPNGYNQEKWKPDGKKENLVITVCGELNENICKRKGIETFIEAAKYVPEAKFMVIGRRTEYSNRFEEKAPKNVEFVDFMPQEELLKYYQKVKVYCQLSRYEGHPNALNEAMLCECVPVGTKYGGIPAVIGDVGLYVPYGNAKATAEAIKKALNSDRGKEAREMIKTLFPLDRREKELVNIIRDFIGV